MNSFKIVVPITVVPVAYWSYEKAFCTGFITRIGLHYEQEVEAQQVLQLHEQFARAFGVNPSNKQTFCVWNMNTHNDGLLFATFHDNRMYLGTNIRPYRGEKLPAPTKEYESAFWIEWANKHLEQPITKAA